MGNRNENNCHFWNLDIYQHLEVRDLPDSGVEPTSPVPPTFTHVFFTTEAYTKPRYMQDSVKT